MASAFDSLLLRESAMKWLDTRPMKIPTQNAARPDPARLEERYEQFLAS